MSWPYLATCRGPQQDGYGDEYCPINLTTDFDCVWCRDFWQMMEERWGDCDRDETDGEHGEERLR